MVGDQRDEFCNSSVVAERKYVGITLSTGKVKTYAVNSVSYILLDGK